ncbi:hypothetical protein [Streptomyces sp. AB3(2024)]|uniref:hypothetical protein n=1 Tax=Streptomyces sp. AB3(2024) TaxID=3317321 RepID=UPI0035A36DFA
MFSLRNAACLRGLSERTSVPRISTDPAVARSSPAVQYLSRGESVYGTRVWPRHEIENRRDNPPGQGKGGGRRPGQGQGPRKAHAYEGDPRLHTAAEALNTAGDTPLSRSAAVLAQEHGGSPRTWERLLGQARTSTSP